VTSPAGDLRADVLGDRSRRKAIRQQADLHSEIDQPIFEIVARGGHLPPNSGTAAGIRVTEVARAGTVARETIQGSGSPLPKPKPAPGIGAGFVLVVCALRSCAGGQLRHQEKLKVTVTDTV
jgi:hypothetical protein